MLTYTYSQARQHFKEVLEKATNEKVIIKRKSGELYSLRLITQPQKRSPLDIKGIKTKTKTKDILNAIKKSRESR